MYFRKFIAIGLFLLIFSAPVTAKKGVPTSGGEAVNKAEKADLESSLSEEASIREAEALMEEELQNDVDREEQKRRAHALRIQEEMEREEVLGVQNLWSKKRLTRKEKKKYLSIYRPMPKTEEEYNEVSQDIKRAERIDAKPLEVKDPKLVKVDESRSVIAKYNSPPGMVNIDLRNLRTNRIVNSSGVISPNRDKLAYTTVYYDGYSDKVSSDAFYLPLDTSLSLKKSVQSASLVNSETTKLVETGFDEEYFSLFKTLTVLDWSKDGKKIAYKERIGSSYHGIWQTNVLVFDLENNSSKRLVEVRDAVKYYWITKAKLDIDDYRWDIMPLGWDELNDNRLIVCAYAFTKGTKGTKFLGLFSVDADGKNTQLISETPLSVQIAANGLVLKRVPNQP